MPIRHEVYDYSELYPPVLARASNLRSPRSVELDPDYVSTREGAYRNQKILRPGYMAGTIPGSTMYRPLPRTLTTADSGTVAGGDPYIITVTDASIFIVGETIAYLNPQTSVEIASSSTGWVAGNQIELFLDGSSIGAITVESGDIGGSLAVTNSNLRNKLVAAINAGPLAYKVGAIAQTTSGFLRVYSKDKAWEPTITVFENGANGTVTASDSTLEVVAIGAITAIDVATNTITTAATSSSLSNLPAGLAIGVPTSNPFDAGGKVLGMISPNTVIDLLYRENTNVGLFTELSVYAERLPYWDSELQRLYPTITLV